MPNVHSPISFAVTEWPTSPGSQNFYFNSRNANQNIGNFLMLIAKRMYEARQPFTSLVPFTIVNAYSPKSKVSLGYDEAPPPSKFYSNNTPLVLTFALTRDKIASNTKAEQIRKPHKDSYIWGDSVFNRSKYFTIKITPEEAAEFKLEQMLISNLRYIYFVVGLFTKNLVRNNNWYSSKPTFIDEGHAGLESIVHAISLPNLFKNYDFTYWAYNEQIWKNASNLLIQDHVNDNLMLYYSAYLYRIKPEFGELSKTFDKQLSAFLNRGLYQIVGAINGGGDYLKPPGVAALIYLYRILNGVDPSYVDETQWAFDLVSQIKRTISDSEQKIEFARALENKPKIIDKLKKVAIGDTFIDNTFKGVRHAFR